MISQFFIWFSFIRCATPASPTSNKTIRRCAQVQVLFFVTVLYELSQEIISLSFSTISDK